MNTAIEILTRVIEQDEEIVIERYLIETMSIDELRAFERIVVSLIQHGWSYFEEPEDCTLILKSPYAQPCTTETRRKTVVSRIVGPKLLGEKFD